MSMENEGGVVVRGRVEIDTRQPFRSVKEAVSLFGEKILVGEIYTNKLKEVQTKRVGREEQLSCRPAVKEEELEETKQSLEKSKEEGNLMAYYLHSLQKELEQTKKELQQLKISREFVLSSDHYHQQHQKPPPTNDDEIEELKFIENSDNASALTHFHRRECELEKKRSVKFASPPMLTRVIITEEDRNHHLKVESSNSSPSVEHKPKRKPLFSGLGLLFARKKGHQKDGSGTPRC